MCTAEDVSLVLHKESARVVTIKSAHKRLLTPRLKQCVGLFFKKNNRFDHLKSRKLRISVLVFGGQLFILVLVNVYL